MKNQKTWICIAVILLVTTIAILTVLAFKQSKITRKGSDNTETRNDSNNESILYASGNEIMRDNSDNETIYDNSEYEITHEDSNYETTFNEVYDFSCVGICFNVLYVRYALAFTFSLVYVNLLVYLYF